MNHSCDTITYYMYEQLNINRSMLNYYYILYGKSLGLIYLANINGQRNQYKDLTFLNGHN